MFQGGETALQAVCGEFDSLPVHKLKIIWGLLMLPHLEGDLKVIAFDNWYDGPWSGVIDYHGRWYYLYIEDLYDYEYDAPATDIIYELYDLPPERWNEWLESHQAWNECCGNYSFDLPEDHVPNGKLTEYYQKYPPKPHGSEIEGLEPIYWCTLEQLKYERKRR